MPKLLEVEGPVLHDEFVSLRCRTRVAALAVDNGFVFITSISQAEAEAREQEEYGHLYLKFNLIRNMEQNGSSRHHLTGYVLNFEELLFTIFLTCPYTLIPAPPSMST